MQIKSKLMILLGIILVFCSVGLMFFSNMSTYKAQQETAEIVAHIQKILPTETIGSEDDNSSSEMPSLEFNKRSIVGLLEIPTTNTVLPVDGVWNEKTLKTIPQRFSGTVYDGSLVVGGYDRKDQFDCLEKLDIGNNITVTDMMGSVFSYKVELIERKKSAKKEDLQQSSYNLTLFTYDINSKNYIIVRCK